MKSPHKFSIHPSHCFYALVWGVIVGVVATQALKFTVFAGVAYGILAIILALIALKIPNKLTIFLALFAGMIFGILRGQSSLGGEGVFTSLTGKEIAISGQITDDPDQNGSNVTVKINHLELCDLTGVKSLQNGLSVENLQAYCGKLVEKSTLDCGKPVENCQKASGKPVENSQNNRGSTKTQISGMIYVKLVSKTGLNRGDRVYLQGQLSSGFGTFAGLMDRPKLLFIDQTGSNNPFLKIKKYFVETTRRFVSSPQSELGLSYLMGAKSGLTDDFSEKLRAVGMTHVVVASGAHLGILVGATRKLFGKISKFAGTATALGMIFSFACIVGFTPSMTRASLVAVLSLLVGYVGRQFSSLRLLVLVAALTLLIDPTYIFNLGWQLSFGSFFGIMILAPHLEKWLYGEQKVPWLASMLITSFATSIVCAPILIYNFGSISLLSFIANLIILPTLPYAMLLVFLTGIFGFWETAAKIIGQLAKILLNLHMQVVEFLSQQNTLIMEISPHDPRIFLLYVLVGILLVFLAFSQRREAQKSSPPNPRIAKSQKICYNVNVKIATEQDMLNLGRKVAGRLELPAVIELVGDVGAGKTTFTRGLAEGLGITEPVTSPSFTLSKRYSFKLSNLRETKTAEKSETTKIAENSGSADVADKSQNTKIAETLENPETFGELVHYDFYRLEDPGIMREELAETLVQSNTVAVVEWGGEVADLLPANKISLKILLQEDGSRAVEITGLDLEDDK